ncbi:hypothetical protein P7H59_11220 [Enterococcus viikkiensis]|uniref:Uncharacterized protein n=1 Tax=Enterococcus viikkiensis TaxID=930854 RepID=A0ABU3FSQ6_9ENTE|nr:hypothetical protein [Enterococcus viikkiensis]MDT2829011.1 hypothetical protein [Enterococcus viikkiensis]
MRNDFEYVTTISEELARKLSDFKAAKVIVTGAMIGVLCTGYWMIALFILLPFLWLVNKVGKKALGL